MRHSEPILQIMALVSVGRHPTSGRSRRAPQDARAVELGLRLAGEGLSLLHAGDSDNSALRQYLGMGPQTIDVIEQADTDDAIGLLVRAVELQQPHIVLTGMRAESGEGSGMTPYVLAQQLGWPMVSGIADIVHIQGRQAQLLQALPGGQRRAISVDLPFIGSVDNAAHSPRQSAYGAARRGCIKVQSATTCVDKARANWQVSAAKKRPKRIAMAKATTAAERLKAATVKSSGGGGRVMLEESNREKAQAILVMLKEEGVLS